MTPRLTPWPTGSGGEEDKKPLVRGWIHAVTAPLALAASTVLLVLAPTTGTKWASAIYLACSLILFAFSGVYHLLYWGPRGSKTLRRIDHANIFLLIAGTYTPITVGLLEGRDRTTLLTVVWAGALIGILMRVFWLDAPRWVYTPIYILLGWVAVWYFPQLKQAGGSVVLWLLVAGGIAYTVGAVVYALKRPNPWPSIFGFHEFFHAGTVAGWTCHCVAAYLAVLYDPF